MARVIVFDLDDTLYLERDYVRSGFQAVERRLGVDGFCATAWRLFEAGARGDVFDQAMARHGIRTPVAELVEVYRSHAPDIVLRPEVLSLIRELASQGRALALISDGAHVSQAAKVEALGLAGLLDPIILTDAWGADFWKPHARAFETVMAAHGGDGAEYVYVADNPAKDFLAPRELGWRTIRMRWPGALHEGVEAPGCADHQACDYAELRELLDV